MRTRLFLPAAALLGLVLAGCNLNQLPEAVIATDAPTQIVTPTATALPTLPPTPTTAPEITLRQGDQLLRNGSYEAAATTYQTLVNQAGAPPEDSAAAAFGAGQAALREGLYAPALEALTAFIEARPSDARTAQAHYLRGDAQLGLGEWREAIADFEAYLALRPGMIDSYVYERIGDAQLGLGETDAALASYAKAADASRALLSLLAFRQRVAQVYASARRTADAVAQYDAIVSAAPTAALRASAALRAAQTLLDAGDTQGGLVRMNQVFTGYPSQPEAYHAMQVLTENGVGLEPLARGVVSFNYGDYPLALQAFDDFTEAHINVGDIPAQLYLLLGRAYREIGSSEAALTAFQTIINHYPTDALFGTALLEQGQTRAVQGDHAGAIELYMHMVDLYSYLPEAPEALWRAGYLYSLDGQTEQAQAVFERLADTYPQQSQAVAGLFMLASQAYQANQLDAAERYYAELSVKTGGDDQAAAYFWLGRIALQRGNARTAAQAFAQVAQAAPQSYFAARAAELTEGLQPFTPPAQLQFLFDEAADAAEAEAWLRQTYGIAQEGALGELAPELANDSRLLRARELWNVGEYNEAAAEFDGLIAVNQSNALACYQLALYFREIGAYYNSVMAISYVIRNAQVNTLDAPVFIARLRFPTYYLDLMQDVAQRRDLDPLLLLALTRQESLFSPYAVGSGGELGLMQVAPGVADYIASELGWRTFLHADAVRPYVGIELGAFYLQEQLRRFGGNIPAALSAYSAGAGLAQRWFDLAGSDPDQLVTLMDSDSARAYVESIYSYYNIYRALYAA